LRLSITGDTLIYTNAPVNTNNVSDAPGKKTFVVVSTYASAPGRTCDDKDSSDCAIHIKNAFSCTTTAYGGW
jgi:hypothetical protein